MDFDYNSSKPVAVVMFATLLEFYIYTHYELEFIELKPIALVFPACMGIISIFLDPDIIIALNMVYLLFCITLLHFPYWEFIMLHPFVWSVIHKSEVIPTQYYHPILTLRHVSYTLQRLTPKKIHWQISIALSGGVYVMYDHLFKYLDETYKTHIDAVTFLTNVFMNICFMILWVGSPVHGVTTQGLIDCITAVSLVVLYRFVRPLYARSIINSAGYILPYFFNMPYMVSINQCMTLAIKEELYTQIDIQPVLRFIEHAVGFAVGYSVSQFDIPYAEYIAIGGLIVSQCGLRYYKNDQLGEDCRCQNVV
jgi:small basic protein